MKLLLVGGTGTISYDATKLFIEKGHDVYLLNRGNRNDLSYENLHYIKGDAYDYNALADTLSGYKFDVILDFVMFNTSQMENRLRIYNGKCKQFIFISSATAYTLTNDVIDEDHEIANTNWSYSKGKIECEHYLKEHQKDYSFYYTIVRPYVTYDARRLPFPVVTKRSYYSVIDRILNRKPVVICGDGNNILTLTSTLDFAVALEGLLLNEGAKYQAFHITSGFTTTWNDILRIIENELGMKADAVYIPIEKLANLFPSEHDELIYDKSKNHIYTNKKIKNAVPDFNPRYDVETGLNRTIVNLLDNPDMQKIDKQWNYTIDTIIDKYEKETLGKAVHKASLWEKLMYWLYEESNAVFFQKVFNRLRRYRGYY